MQKVLKASITAFENNCFFDDNFRATNDPSMKIRPLLVSVLSMVVLVESITECPQARRISP